jgi:pyridoxamine 5'-phosphate oxidase
MSFADRLLAIFAPGQTLPVELPDDPFPIVKSWLDEATAKKVQQNPNAMTLATVDPDGKPSARVVLCKDLDVGRGAITFYTNYESRKSRGLEAHARAAVVFHWDALDRQLRIEGPVVRVSAQESDAYFATRPWQSRLGAWASHQSEPIESRTALLGQVLAKAHELGISTVELLTKGDSLVIPRPSHWGGWRLYAERVELWLGATGRVHDRAAWTRQVRVDAAEAVVGAWAGTRLQP